MNPHTHTHTGCVCVDFFSLPFVPHGTLSAINADAGGGQRPLLRQQPSRRSFSLSLSMFLGLFRYSEAGRVRLSKRGAPVAQPFYLRPFIPSSDVLIGRRKQKSFFFSFLFSSEIQPPSVPVRITNGAPVRRVSSRRRRWTTSANRARNEVDHHRHRRHPVATTESSTMTLSDETKSASRSWPHVALESNSTRFDWKVAQFLHRLSLVCFVFFFLQGNHNRRRRFFF